MVLNEVLVKKAVILIILMTEVVSQEIKKTLLKYFQTYTKEHQPEIVRSASPFMPPPGLLFNIPFIV